MHPRFSEPAERAGEVRNIRLREQPGGIGFREGVARPSQFGDARSLIRSFRDLVWWWWTVIVRVLLSSGTMRESCCAHER